MADAKHAPQGQMKDIFSKSTAEDFLKTFQEKEEPEEDTYDERIGKMKGSELGNEYYKLKSALEKATGAKKAEIEKRIKSLLRIKKDAKF